VRFIPFSRPEIGFKEIYEVITCLRSGWITTGPKVKTFEFKFSKFLQNNFETIAVNSATSGLHLALEALGIKYGDEVITTTYTFTATAEVIRYLGAAPVFIDINPHTLNIDHNKIEKAITSKTKAILVVHFAGLPCNMDKILNIANKFNLKVIEDAAHAFPTIYNKKIIGNLNSDATVFSFYANKTITTGEGGMVVVKDANIAKRIKLMRLHGINKDAFDRYTSRKSSWYYEVIAPGYKYNMTDLAASIGIHQLDKAYKFQKKRELIAKFYTKELSNLPLILPSEGDKEDLHSWHLYVIRLGKELNISRGEFIELMYKNGIGCSVHYIPLHVQPYWRKKYNLEKMQFPESIIAYEKSVSLPIYPGLKLKEQKRIISTIKKIISK
tara:strand:- start:470 stop:1621 length:1152 start_codon:yes stop_codon:yes gene_type:complete